MPWAETPTAAEMAAAYPGQSADRRASGHVVLRCGVDYRSLKHCAVTSETPAGQGFARAALGLTGRFKVLIDPIRPSQFTGDTVDLPFEFRGPGQSSGPPLVNPLWLWAPDPATVALYFPRAAATAGLRIGVGVVECDVAHDGVLGSCAVTREEPAGLGFGGAALAVSKLMVASPWTREGAPADGARVIVPIKFDFGSASSPPSTGFKIASFGAGWTKRAGAAGPYTPERGCRMGVRNAVAVIDCTTGLDGTLSACTVVGESPSGFGFGEAAMKMAQRRALMTTPVMDDGKPVADQVIRLSVPFTIPPGNCMG
jgi:hypothetical protein